MVQADGLSRDMATPFSCNALLINILQDRHWGCLSQAAVMNGNSTRRRNIMLRKVLTLFVALLWVATLSVSSADARQGNQKSTGKAAKVQTQKGSTKGVCPFGNTPGTRQGQIKAKGHGPGDGAGNNGDGPKDGTGFGAVKGSGQSNNPNCDGDGPKGSTKRKGRPQ
jgi:hypothetical protein